jgi:GNAT superfamily N-acetyltransferase
MRGLYRQEANCQIIHDSCLGRGIADPYLVLVDGRVGGYGGVWNRYDPGQVMEFYTLPDLRPHALPMFRELLAASRATRIEAQTNMPLMTLMLLDCGENIRAENVLFADAFTTRLDGKGAVLRGIGEEDKGASSYQPEGDWVLEIEGRPAGSGGYLCHYNPPYGDIYMDIAEPQRRQGYGSFLVQEMKRVCYEAGKRPAARCNPGNVASRRTLEKAGFLPVGRLLVADVKPEISCPPGTDR